ncbi:hypothetical protein ZIOFF_075560 [Zingiber officinale]|uniref:Uncharacterized protein n=1 Tax=Zingiber officinale TaxID=94328 RepID=A0A8J5C0D6_ZINOF|nr:hypothetical protein ZIOFF_075560 [Zingiber officinale]
MPSAFAQNQAFNGRSASYLAITIINICKCIRTCDRPDNDRQVAEADLVKGNHQRVEVGVEDVGVRGAVVDDRRASAFEKAYLMFTPPWKLYWLTFCFTQFLAFSSCRIVFGGNRWEATVPELTPRAASAGETERPMARSRQAKSQQKGVFNTKMSKFTDRESENDLKRWLLKIILGIQRLGEAAFAIAPDRVKECPGIPNAAGLELINN